MSFRYGAKSVMRNPKPCSIKTTTLIKPYIWALIEKTLQVLLMGVGGREYGKCFDVFVKGSA